MPPDPAAGIDLDALAEAVAAKVAAQLAGVPARRYLSVNESATYMSISADSVRALISGGRLTALRPVGGRVVLDKREIDGLMAGSTGRPKRRRGCYDRRRAGPTNGPVSG